MSIPVLAMHGTADRIILPAMTEHVLNICPTETGSWYEGVGPMPFMEEPHRFNEELAAFATERAHDSRVWTTLAL